MRYPALRLIVGIQYVLAAILALLVFAFTRAVVLASRPDAEVTAAAVGIVVTVLATLGLVAFAELLRVLMDIEESVRALRPAKPLPGAWPDPSASSGPVASPLNPYSAAPSGKQVTESERPPYNPFAR